MYNPVLLELSKFRYELKEQQDVLCLLNILKGLNNEYYAYVFYNIL